jgi:hypothetical protein
MSIRTETYDRPVFNTSKLARRLAMIAIDETVPIEGSKI